MVTRKAHNLETGNASVGSIPTPATNTYQRWTSQRRPKVQHLGL